MSIYLVTGGAGFIGSNLVAELLARGETVRVLDNFAAGSRQNLEPFGERIEMIEGDIRSYHIVREAVDNVDFILHQAALPSVLRSIRDPITTSEVNVSGTLNLLQAAREARVKRVVYASSSSIYGNNPTLPKTEDMIPTPLSPYAVSKLAAEQYCRVFTEIFGLETVSLRYFNVFGPRQNPDSQYAAAIPKFIRAIQRGESPVVFGDGLQSRDFTYVGNVVQANFLACAAAGIAGQVFNIACGQRLSLLELIDQINAIQGTSIKPKFEQERPGDVRHSEANIERARKELGYTPSISFQNGLKKTIEWHLQASFGRNDIYA